MVLCSLCKPWVSFLPLLCVSWILNLFIEHVFFLTDEDPRITDQTLNVSQLEKVHTVVPAPSLGAGQQNLWPSPIWEVPPTNKKMPPLKDFRLTKALVQQRVKDNVVIVTFGNYAFMDFILTWVKQLTDLGISNLLVGECCRFSSFLFCRVILFRFAVIPCWKCIIQHTINYLTIYFVKMGLES